MRERKSKRRRLQDFILGAVYMRVICVVARAHACMYVYGETQLLNERNKVEEDKREV